MVSNRLLYLYCEPGEDVKDFQDGVNAARTFSGQSSAFNPLAVDGIFGSNSLKRAREFQQMNGLQVDGLVGQATWGKLLTLLHGKGGHIPADRPPGGAGGGQTKGFSGKQEEIKQDYTKQDYTKQVGGKQVFGKPIPGNTVGKDSAAGGSGHKAGMDPFGQKTAPGSHKVSWW